MKTTVTALFVLVTMFAFACGGGETEQRSTADESVTEDVSVEDDVPLEAEVVVAPLYPEGKLDPALISVDVPISAVALFDSYYAWDGQSVVLQGYPYVFYGDSITVESELELVAVAEDRDILARFTFAEPLNLTIPAGELVTVSGTIDYYRTGELRLVDAQIIRAAPPVESFEFSPYLYDGVSTIEILEFSELFSIWMGMEVTVDGYYYSTTVSSLSSGDIVRVDLSDPETNSKCVACEMTSEISEEISAAMLENRANTQIRGIVTGESFSMVGLEECELVNR